MSAHDTNKKPSQSASVKGPITVKLFEPIQWGSEVISEITLSRPRAKHIKNLDTKNIKVADLLSIASKISGVSSAALDELSTDDAKQVIEAVGELL